MIRAIFIFFLLVSTVNAQPFTTSPPLEVTEEDSSPSTYPYKVKFSNGTVTDNGDGTVSVSNTGTGSSTVRYDQIDNPNQNSGIEFTGFSNSWTSTLSSGDFFNITRDANFTTGDSILSLNEGSGNPDGGSILEINNSDTQVRHILADNFVIYQDGSAGLGTTSNDSYRLNIKSAGTISQKFIQVRDNAGTNKLDLSSDISGNGILKIFTSLGVLGIDLEANGNSIFTVDTYFGANTTGSADHLLDDNGDAYFGRNGGTIIAGSGATVITNSVGKMDETKVIDADLGDISTSSGVWSVNNNAIRLDEIADPNQHTGIILGGFNSIWTSTTGTNLWTSTGTTTLDYFTIANAGQLQSGGSILRLNQNNATNPTGGSVLSIENYDPQVNHISAPNFTITQSGGVTASGSITSNVLTSGSALFAGTNGLINQDNANYFWDDTNNSLAIGQATAAVKVNGSTFNPRFTTDSSSGFYNFNNSIHSNTFTDAANNLMTRSRGTNASPTIVANDDKIGIINGLGYTGNSSTGNQIAASVEMAVDSTGSISTTSMPGRIVLNTTQNGSTSPIEAMRISSDQSSRFSGKVRIGDTNVPSAQLEIIGNTATLASAGTNVWTSTTGNNLWTASNTSGNYFKIANTGNLASSGSILQVANTGNASSGTAVLDIVNSDTDMDSIRSLNFTVTQTGGIKSTSNTAGNIFIADGSKFNPTAMSGDCTITSSGLTTCLSSSTNSVPFDKIKSPTTNSGIDFSTFNNVWTSSSGTQVWTSSSTSGDYFKVVNTGAYGANSNVLKIAQTGNPTGGAVLLIQNSDTDSKTIDTQPSNFSVSQSGQGIVRGGLAGGTASSHDLDLYANTVAFDNDNTGRIDVNDRIDLFPDGPYNFDYTTNFFNIISENLINMTSTIVAQSGTNSLTITGYNFAPTIQYSSNQVISNSPTFNAGTIMQPTAAITDAGSTTWSGFQSILKFQPSLATAVAATTPLVVGYNSSPSAVMKTGSHASATSTVTRMDAYLSGGNGVLSAAGLQSTVTTYNHHNITDAGVSGTGAALTNQYGINIGALTSGGTLIAGVASAITSGTGKWFLYDTGGADSSLKGQLRLGDNTAPGALFDVAGKLKISSSGLVTKYNNTSTVSGGVPAELATVDLTAQGAAIGATTLYAVPSTGAGMYRVSWVATVTRAATTSSVLGGTGGFQVVYTDADDSVVKTTPGTIVAGVETNSTNSTATGTISGSYIVYAKASTNIQYQMGYTSVGATSMQYNLHIKLECL